MLVKFQGFTLEAGDGFSLEEFAQVLVDRSSQTDVHDFNDHARIFLFESNSDKDFHTGLLITTKDQRSFCELRDAGGGKFKIKVSELEEGAQLMDFNFFILNKNTFAGMYQHYHASCSALQFGTMLRHVFWKEERDVRCAGMRKYLIQGGMNAQKAERESESYYRRLMKFDLLYKPDGFRKILKTMREIHGFQFDVSTKVPKHDAFIPQAIELKKETRRVLFANKGLVGKIADSVGSFVAAHALKKGTVEAVDADGIVRMIDISVNVEGFGEFDFDQVAAEIELDLEKFAQSWVTKELLASARANKAIFCEP